MANTTLTADIVAKEALVILENELGVLDTFHRAHEDEFAGKVNGFKVGDTIRIRRPADFTVRSGATMDLQDAIEGRTTLTINKQIGVDFAFTQTDMALKVSDLSDRFIKPAIINIVNEMARDCFSAFYQSVYNWVGTPGNTVDSFADFAKAPERMDLMAIPVEDRYAALHPSDHWGLLGAQTGMFITNAAESAYRRGKLGMIGGVDTYMSQVLPTHTTGTRDDTTPIVKAGTTPSVSYDTVKNAWTQDVVFTGFDNPSTLTAGDVFTIADLYMVNPKTKARTGVLQQFVVITAATNGAGDQTLTISPPIITSGPHKTVELSTGDLASNAVVNVGTASTAYRQNLVYHKNAFALAVVPMELPEGAVRAARQSYKGFSVRVIPVYDGINDVSKWRLDLLYGRSCIDPRLAVRLSGT